MQGKFKKLLSFFLFFFMTATLLSQVPNELIYNNDTTFTDSLILDSDKLDTILLLNGEKDLLDSIGFFRKTGVGNDLQMTKETYKIAPNDLEKEVKYGAKDSFMMEVPLKLIHIYNKATVEHDNATLQSAYIKFNWDKSEAESYSYTDSLGRVFGKPFFTESGKDFMADELKYNFSTNRGKSKGLITTEAEGFLHGKEIKTFGDEYFYGKNVRYTTCDHEHPHFYIEVNKAKVVKDKLIVGKPANLVIGGMRTPFVLPMGVFPMPRERNSGFILPRYGRTDQLGFFFTGMGYYWAINDFTDLTATANIYTRGTWGLDLRHVYVKNYKFRSDMNVAFNTTRSGERQNPNKPSPRRDFRIGWNMTIDQKSLHNSNFSSSINFATSSFRDNNLQNTDVDRIIDNTINSSLAYSKWWPGKLPRFSLNARHSQNINEGTISITAPSINFGVSSFSPFKRKSSIGQPKWYERMNFSYSTKLENQLNSVDSLMGKKETYRDMLNGMQHTASFSLPVTFFKHINTSLNFNHTENWYARTLERIYVQDTLFQGGDTIIRGSVVDQSNYGFKAARNFSLGVNVNWNLYGTWNFKRTKNVMALRHVMRPRMSFSFSPDFGEERWGFYRTVQRNPDGDEQVYSIFTNTLYGGPGRGLQANIGFGVNNNLEMKIRSKRDTITGIKKISLLDNFDISGSFNVAGDSLTQKMRPISFTGNTQVFQNRNFNMNLNFSGALDPLYINPETNSRVSRWRFPETKRFFRITQFNFYLRGRIQSPNQTGNRGGGLPVGNINDFQDEQFMQQQGSVIELRDPVFGYLQGYIDFNIPWSMDFDYSISMQRFYRNGKDTSAITQNIRMNIDFSLTPNWKIAARGIGYDITNKQFNAFTMSIYRDLHCWQLAFNVSPIGERTRSFSFDINVKSQILRDLKYSRQKLFVDYL
jgi:hypothetical protein